MVTDATIKEEILAGLKQVDSSFIITNFVTLFDKETRKLKVRFVATNKSGETISDEVSWG